MGAEHHSIYWLGQEDINIHYHKVSIITKAIDFLGTLKFVRK